MTTQSLPRVPTYRRHKPTGQAVVTLDGHDIYLGKWNATASRQEYDRLIGEWLSAGRRLPRAAASHDTTIIELAASYWRFAQGYYRKDGKPTRSLERVRLALKVLRQLYGPTCAGDFGPLALQAIQQRFVREGKARPYVNCLIEEIKRVFKWGVSQELVPALVFQALATVPGLRKGRTDAPEPQPIGPVAAAVVDATLPHLPPVVREMVRFQSLTGCRPGEVCILRPCDIDRSGDVWAYRPSTHKTEHHSRQRVIFIGPQAQEILRPYLLRNAEAYCFAPADSERKRLDARHEMRKTPLSCGNRPGTNRKRRRKIALGERYDTNAYAKCVRRASDLADRKGRQQARDADPNVKDDRIIPRWSPNQLRHSKATEVRRRFGLEAVQVVLGHAKADVSQIYAERDLGLAERIMREVG
ncbi:MAG TPA: tyrosine-type recombinase/integrase [Pirellulales bacterium]|nr:tyrosine-type recombinase/integrase [Pirellulales bacterium]